MEDYLNPITKEIHKKILDYLDNSIYQIKGKEEKYGAGFFCTIKCHNKVIPLLITSYQIIEENYIKNYKNIEVIINEERMEVEFGYVYYLNKDLNLSVVEIKENNKIRFLDLDDNIYKNESEMYFNKESIYIIHYDNNNVCVSYGVMGNINDYELIFSSNIKKVLNPYPIFNLKANKIIGIYLKNSFQYLKGIYFKFIINELEKIYSKTDLMNNNEINIIINIDKVDIGKKIYFLDNKYEDDNYLKHSSHDNLKELNELNTELYINNKKEKYKKYFIPKKKDYIIFE